MSLKRKFSFAVLTFILFFVFIEASLRLIAHFNKKTLFSSLTVDDSILDWRLTSNYIDERNGIYINSLGFRGREFNREKKEGIFRIIALGDSCTFGVGAEGTTYPELLEKKLNSSGLKYQVINAGVPGYTSSQALLHLQHNLMDYKPDLILVYIGWNDIWTYKNPADNTAYSPTIRKASKLVSKSLSFTLLRNYIINPLRIKLSPTGKIIKNDSVFEDRFREKTAIFRENISCMIKFARKNGCRIMLLTLPSVIRKGMLEEDILRFPLAITWRDGCDTFLKMYKQLNNIIKEVGEEEKVEILDLDFIFSQFPLENIKLLFNDAVHPNEKGLLIIAEHILDNIIHERKV